MASTRIPVATYRLQFHRDFRFADACKILDYLAALGISDIYASPILASRRGSMHGYDGTDPTRIDPDLGTEEEFAAFQQELQKRGMGLLLDVVPNHMAAKIAGGWTFLKTGRTRRSPHTLMWTGTRDGRAWTAEFFCRSSANRSAKCWMRANSPW